jgi:Ca2+-binding EF-hand superfamily protein
MNKKEGSKFENIKALQSCLEDPLKLRYITKEIFKLIDEDGNEYIELDELYNIMCIVARQMKVEDPSYEDIKDIVNTFDTDYDEKISVDEFEVFVREILEKMIENEMKTIDSLTIVN